MTATFNEPVGVETIGWLPTCECGQDRTPVSCWVLDPFCGSGTVSLVCERLGLDSVGIDTSAKYIRFAEDRLAEDAKKRSAIKLDFSAGV